MKTILETTGLFKNFTGKRGSSGTEVLAGIDMNINEGSFTCIAGPTGCGKTTLLRILAGLEKPSAGTIELEGVRADGPDARIGLVFQEFALFPWRNVLNNVTFGLELSGIQKKERIETAMHYISMVGLNGFENYYPAELSGGMKQRAAIARTLAARPKVLLMDEPFGSLDAQTRNAMQELLLKLWEETGVTVIFVTHNVDEAVFLGREVIGLTSRPACIKEVFDVPLEYPRDRTGNRFVEIRREILAYLAVELKNEEQPIYKRGV